MSWGCRRLEGTLPHVEAVYMMGKVGDYLRAAAIVCV